MFFYILLYSNNVLVILGSMIGYLTNLTKLFRDWGYRMFRNGRKTIGVFITQIHQEFQDTLMRGICLKSKELGYNVAFFTNYLGNAQYEVGEQDIADLPNYEDLDGIIIIPDSYGEGFEQRIREHIRKDSNCPVVSIRQKRDEYYNVLIDDDTVMDEILFHFLDHHGYRKINFLTGPKDNPASIKRLEAFKRALSAFDVPFEEERVFYGDFWKEAGYHAVEQWLKDPEMIPEAIICVNDYMAFTVCNALSEKGYSVPEDIAVSGCDDVTVAEDFSPSITTASMPIFEMGIEAVDKIHKHSEAINQDKNSYLKTVTYFRESCGCEVRRSGDLMNARRNRIIEEIEAKELAIQNNAFMSIDLTGVKAIDELDQKVAACTYMSEGYASFYMCLHKDWDAFDEENITDTKYGKDMIMEVGIRNGEWLQKEEFSVNHSLLPSCHKDKEPQFFMFNMLHYQEKCFGYTANSFYEPQAYKVHYQGWLINICNALENVRVNTEMSRLIYKMEDMYIKDELTGLYNRRALDMLGQKYLDQSIVEQTKLMVFTADMDKLKYINDNFGHAGGDVAIKAVANALFKAAKDDEICMRVGGDEFTVIGLEYDESKMERFVRSFEEEIKRFNVEEGYLFMVDVSYGWSIILPNQSTTIEDCIVVADAKMYQQKYEKEKYRLRLQKMDEKNQKG